VAIVGPNGAGKSTLFKGIIGAIKPFAGRIERDGLKPQDIAYLPAGGESIARSDQCLRHGGDGPVGRTGLFGGVDRGAQASIEQAIAAVGLTGFEDRAIATLSGGQMQRMLFARLLLQDARVIVLTSRSTRSTPDLADRSTGQALARRAATVLTALHDIDSCAPTSRDAPAGARAPSAWGSTATVLTRRTCSRRGACASVRRACGGMRRGGPPASVRAHRDVVRPAFIGPFAEFEFMRRGSPACWRWRSAPGPIGVS